MSSQFSFHSSLGEYIQNFIAEKQAMGFKCMMQSYLMQQFDRYWEEQGFTSSHLTPESLEGWVKKRDSECKEHLFTRVSVVSPTVHSLRHTFVVKRVNLWMRQGLDMNVMMPYLSKHLGHKGIDETYYYYHYVEESARIISEKDALGKKVIPEARRR